MTHEEQVEVFKKEAECSRLGRQVIAMERKIDSLRAEADAIRCRVILRDAKKYLGQFRWSPEVRRMRAIDLVALTPAGREGKTYRDQVKELADISGMVGEHDILHLAEGVQLKIDDDVVRLYFSSGAHRTASFMREHGLLDRIQTDDLRQVSEGFRGEADEAIAQAEIFEAIVIALQAPEEAP